MYSVKEIADLLQVSKPTVQKVINTLGISAAGTGSDRARLYTPEDTRRIITQIKRQFDFSQTPDILREMQKDANNMQSTQSEDAKVAQSDANTQIIELLRQQLDQKDQMIEEYRQQIEVKDRQIEQAQQLVDQAQKLHAAAEQRLKQLEDKHAADPGSVQQAADQEGSGTERIEPKESWIRRLFKRREHQE